MTTPDFMDKGSMLNLMNKYLVITDEGFVYIEGWSDLLIAEEVNPNFKAHHAAVVRRAKFGFLAHQAKEIETPPPPARIDILEQRLSRIIDVLASNSPRSAQHRRYLLDGSSSTAHLDDI